MKSCTAVDYTSRKNPRIQDSSVFFCFVNEGLTRYRLKEGYPLEDLLVPPGAVLYR
ncbi:hypothetical protein [Methanothrix soehngenii]|uniref:hypothetical protein n=1 Tax=Methanothrix soehngenii TaxID=2223 RepID=UPI002357FE06|nr:hypothetical protein [Methanothrix soehngenii]